MTSFPWAISLRSMDGKSMSDEVELAFECRVATVVATDVLEGLDDVLLLVVGGEEWFSSLGVSQGLEFALAKSVHFVFCLYPWTVQITRRSRETGKSCKSNWIFVAFFSEGMTIILYQPTPPIALTSPRPRSRAHIQRSASSCVQGASKYIKVHHTQVKKISACHHIRKSRGGIQDHRCCILYGSLRPWKRGKLGIYATPLDQHHLPETHKNSSAQFVCGPPPSPIEYL